MARVNTYLNFSRNTEEAFNYYKQIFGGEFVGNGIARFRDVPMPEGAPPMSAEDGNLIMHIELELPGGHIIMATDAPESMGFNVTKGNNMHLSIEPDTRAEADRLFAALSDQGTVTMPLADMFWGAYYGSCTDKFGIQWMINCPTK